MPRIVWQRKFPSSILYVLLKLEIEHGKQICDPQLLALDMSQEINT